MIVTATELANDSKSVLDRILERNISALVQRRGRTVVEIRRKAGVSREEFLDRLQSVRFTAEESGELKAVMNAAAEVFGYAGSN
jgi:hypothetical protein